MTTTYIPQSPARTALGALRNEVGKAVVGQEAASRSTYSKTEPSG